MKVEIISEITIANPKVNDDLTVFPIRYKIKNGMVTVL